MNKLKSAIKLSTDQYIEKLNKLNLQKSGIIRLDKVNLDCEKFVKLMENNPKFELLRSSDGTISTVVDSDTTNSDYSKQSGFFDLHTDGLYYAKVPDLVLLYCASPGNMNIPTVFVDTRKVLKEMEKIGTLSKLKEIEMVYRSKDSKEYKRSFIEDHPFTAETIVNLGSRVYFRPIEGSKLSGRELTYIIHKFFEQVDKTPPIIYEWERQMTIIFDNARYIHGRGLICDSMGLQQDRERELKRIWLAKRN